MAPGRIRLELVRIRREIKRAIEMQGDATAILKKASKDHERVVRELSMVKNNLLHAELLELATRVQQEGIAARSGLVP